MTINFGYVPASSTLYIPFATYNSSGASVTITGLAVTDIEIYKNGSVTQRASDNGYTLLDTDGIDFDGITGIHGFSVDLSDNSDSGFYSAGGQYVVVVSAITADSQTVSFVAAVFRIGPVEANVSQFGGTAGTFASGIPAASLTTSAINAVADQVFDEAVSGHVASGSYGAALQPTDIGTATAGAASTITLRAGAVATDDYYNKQLLKIVAGTGAGQSEYISDYVGSTKVATMAANWKTNPDNTSVYSIGPGGTIPGASAPTAAENADAVWDELRSDHVAAGSFGQGAGAQITRANTAQSGTTSSITLDASASATNNLYRYHSVEIISGTGAGEVSYITSYTGSSKVAAVDPAFTVAPDNTSVFVLRKLGLDAATPAQVATSVWGAARSGNNGAGTFGEYVNADTLRISGDATAADNLEAALDGSGGVTITAALTGNITGNLSGSVGSVTGAVGSVTGAVGSVTGAVGSVTGAVGSVTGAVGSVTGNVGGNVTGSVGSLAAQAKADVNAEVVDGLNTDTYAEPGQEAPGATISLAKKIGYLYKMLRNKKTQTATTFSLFADDASTVDQKATVADSAGTTTVGEIATGP